MKRHKELRKYPARVAGIQAMYQMYLTEKTVDEIAKEFFSTFFVVGDRLYSDIDSELFKDIISQFNTEQDFNDLIQKSAINCTFSTTSLVAKCIIRVALIEILFGKVDYPVIISEYIDIAKGFIDDGEVKFVNAVLDGLSKAKLNV